MDTALTAIIGKYDCHFRVIKILEKVNIYCQKLKKGIQHKLSENQQ